LVLAIEQVQTYSKVNFIDLTLILFAGILLLTVTMLTLLKKRLRQIEQNRKDLIMSIAHEMKTPFGIVRLYGEKILITPDPEAKEECASDMMEEIDEMNSLLQNILDASRLDSGSLKLNKTAFIMNDAVQDVIEGYSPLAEDKNIKLTMNAADKFPVEADNYRIKQVISNLLSNAIKNTPENGKIDITIKKEGKNTAVTVKNTGKPIPKEKLSRIWDAFYKHDENADNSKSGAGLGLSIVKNIILLHGGFCGVENKDDGVEFWFRI
jgi:signal transduction histidine kinase